MKKRKYVKPECVDIGMPLANAQIDPRGACYAGIGVGAPGGYCETGGHPQTTVSCWSGDGDTGSAWCLTGTSPTN